MPQSSLRIIGYVRRADLSARVKMAAVAGWVDWRGDDDQVRIAFSSAKLRDSDPEGVASLIVGLVGADVVAGRQVFLQPEPRFYEMSVTLIDASNMPDFYQPSEPISVRQAVLDFLSGMC